MSCVIIKPFESLLLHDTLHNCCDLFDCSRLRLVIDVPCKDNLETLVTVGAHFLHYLLGLVMSYLTKASLSLEVSSAHTELIFSLHTLICTNHSKLGLVFTRGRISIFESLHTNLLVLVCIVVDSTAHNTIVFHG